MECYLKDSKQDFLEKYNLHNLKREKINSDASFRTYERIIDGNNSYILMDSSMEKDKINQFIEMSDFLINNNFSAPKVIQQDVANGLLLLEDFGDNSFNKILLKNDNSEEFNETIVYEKAIDTLIQLHKSPIKNDLSIFDDNKLVRESSMFIDWYVSVLNGESLSKKDSNDFTEIMKFLLKEIKNSQKVIVLKDFHADNLMWLPDRRGVKRVGILDFQDAIIGSYVYDIVSLLEDARREVSEDVVANCITRYLNAFPSYSRKEFMAEYAILGVQRNLRIIGCFARLAVKFKKPKYLSYLPRVWRYVNNDLKHPLLLPLRNWLERVVPSSTRVGLAKSSNTQTFL